MNAIATGKAAIDFDGVYAEYGTQIDAAVKGNAVASVLMQVMYEWAYPSNVLIGCKVAALDLCQPDNGDKTQADPNPETAFLFDVVGHPFVEIVRYKNGLADYGGWVLSGDHLCATSDYANGYRIVCSESREGTVYEHRFVPGFGYEPVSGMRPNAIPVFAQRRIRARRPSLR